MARTHWSLASSSSRRFPLHGAPDQYAPDVPIEPMHMAFQLAVDVERCRIEGSNTLRVVGRVAGSRVLVLHALEFEYCRVEGEGVQATYDGSELRVTFDAPLALGDERTLRVDYAVEAPRSGLCTSPYVSEQPTAARFMVSDGETERARHWMPCIDHPSVRTTLDWSIRTAARWTVLANGAPEGETLHPDGTKTTRWSLAQRCPAYLACFAVGPFIRYDDGVYVGRSGEVPLAYFALPNFDDDHLARTFGRTGDMLAWMEERLDLAFPYPKYYQLAAPGLGGAMENISLVTWDDKLLLDEALGGEWQQTLDQINVHEMAHAYFGDAIVCRDFAHAWLKESWAVFIEIAWLEHDRGLESGQYDTLLCREAYFSEADHHYVRPIMTRTFHSAWELYDRHLYPGGAARLAALRAQLGDATFWRATQTYLRRFEGKLVETSDLVRVFEEVSGKSLHAWFDQWFAKPGYPKLEATFAFDPGEERATLQVKQTQVDAEAGVGLFRLTLEIDVTHGGETSTHVLQLHEESATLTLPMSATPDALRIDPRGKVVHKLSFAAPTPILLRQLREGDLMGRILAGRELCASMRHANIRAVVDAWAEESFWGVRVELAKALAGANTEAAVAGLAGILTAETEGNALVPTFNAAGRVRDPRVAAALEARLDESLPPRAAQAALLSLGKQRRNAPLPRLTRAAEEVGFGGWAQGGAVQALAESRRPGVVEALAEALQPGGLAPDARHAAASALGICLGWLQEGARKETVREALVDALRDANARVGWAAANALLQHGDASCVPAVERFAKLRSDQDRVDLDRKVATLRTRLASKPSARDERLEGLEKRLKEVEAALQRTLQRDIER